MDEGNHVEDVGLKKTMNLETNFAKELEDYRKRCLELEEKSKMDEIRCTMLEGEVENLKKKNEELEEHIKRIQKVVKNEEKGKETIVDLTGEENDEDELTQVMIENKVLECEKLKAETELRVCNEKVKQLMSQVCELESKLNVKVMNNCSIESNDGILHMDNDDVVFTPKCTTERSKRGANQEYCSQVKQRLPFEKDGFSNKKFAPSTPGFVPPPFSNVIDLSDEDENCNAIPKAKKVSDSSFKNNVERTNIEHDYEDDMNGFKRNSQSATRRKRCSNIVTSDDESSDDDNAPICTLKKKDYNDKVKEDVSKRSLKRLRKVENKNRRDDISKNRHDDITIDLNKTGNSLSEDDEDEEEDDESLGGFIVKSSESASEFESESGESFDESESESESKDGLDEYKETLDKIRRKKDSNVKWDLEGDMLADFGKDPELCMRAVCALYRQQTADEKECKVTIHQNARGFSQPDANRGSELAEFLMDGDPDGDLNKTVEELKEYDANGIKLCWALATKYSKQLFEIYKNKEDPFFLPR